MKRKNIFAACLLGALMFAVFPAGVVGEETVPGIIIGDVNGNGRVTSADATILARFLFGYDYPIIRRAADMNCDGEINLYDLHLLARLLVGHNMEGLICPDPDCSGCRQPIEPPDALQGVISVTIPDEPVSRGDTVRATFRLEENPGIATLLLNVEYDRQRLRINSPDDVRRYIDIHPQRALRDSIPNIFFPAVSDNPFHGRWSNVGNNNSSVGMLFVVDFTVSPYAPPGDAYVRLSVTESRRLVTGGEGSVYFPDAADSIAITGFGPVPPTGISNINWAMYAMLALAGLSVLLWVMFAKSSRRS